MIQANELRVGNWVIYNGKAYQIDTISPELPILDADFGVGVVDYNNIHGIPLTPEILEKCGFEKINEGYFACYIGDYTSIELDTEVEFYNVFIKQSDTTDKSIKDNVLLGIEISYLHQLQNLYFSLTNNELQWD